MNLTTKQKKIFKKITNREYNNISKEGVFRENDKNVYFKFLEPFNLLCFEINTSSGVETYLIDNNGDHIMDRRFLEILSEEENRYILNISKDNLDRLVKIKYEI